MLRAPLSFRWPIFSILALGLTLVIFHQSAAAVISSHLTREWTLDAASLGLLGSLWFLPYALLQIPGGYLVDLWGPRRVAAGSLVVMSVGALLFAGASAFELALGARVLIGVGSSLILLPSLKIFAAWFRAREFATVQGLAVLIANLGGGIAATMPLAFFSDRLGWRTPMLAVAVVSTIVAALTWSIVRDSPRERSGIDQGSQHARTWPVEVNGSLKEGSLLRESLRFIIGEPTLWIAWTILFISFGSFLAVQGLWAGPWLRDVRGLTPVETGTWLLLLPVGLAVGSLSFGYVSDRIVERRRPLIIFALGLQALVWGLLIVFIAKVPGGFGQSLFFLLGFTIGGTLLIQVVIKEVCPYHLFGSVFGLMNAAALFGAVAFQLVTGRLLGLIDPVALASGSAYSDGAYIVALAPVGVGAFVAAGLCWLLPETLTE